MFTNKAHIAQSRARPSQSLTTLLQGCRQGDKLSWNAIVERYERLVLSIALREGLNRDQAADATQETFEALVQGMHKIVDAERIGSWLITVAYRTSWRIRSEKRSAGLEQSEPPHLDDGVEQLAESLWVYESVERLEEPCRTLVRSLFLQPNEPTYGDVAVQLGRPVGSIGPMRARCLLRLREILESHDG